MNSDIPQLCSTCTAHIKVPCMPSMDLEARTAPSPPQPFAYNHYQGPWGGRVQQGGGVGDQDRTACFHSMSVYPSFQETMTSSMECPESQREVLQNPGVQQTRSFSIKANGGICTFSAKKSKGKSVREKRCPKPHALQRRSCLLWKFKARTSQRQG